MNHPDRRSRPLVVVLAAAAVLTAGCGSSATTASPPASIAPSASSSAAPSAPPATPTAVPATPTATPSPSVVPSAEPSAAEACPIVPQTGRLPSDRMTGIRLQSTPTADHVIFEFGNMSVPEPPQGASEGTLAAAVPPYTEAASGMEIEMTGEHVAQVRFTGMSLMNDAGEPTYDGPLRLEPDGWHALRSVVNYDMYEGYNGWYIGYDGNGCVTLTSDATSVTVVIDHPAS